MFSIAYPSHSERQIFAQRAHRMRGRVPTSARLLEVGWEWGFCSRGRSLSVGTDWSGSLDAALSATCGKA